MLVRAHLADAVFAGPTTLIHGSDELRYLAYVRAAGDHVLVAPLDGRGAQAYLNPIFVVSGALWRLGLDVRAAYVIWAPVAAGVLIGGCWRYADHFAEGDNARRTSTLLLAGLFVSPLLPLLDWGGLVNADTAGYLLNTARATAPYFEVWGYFPTAIALGLMPVFLLGLERLIVAPDARRRQVLAVMALAVAVGWLHPWSGLTLLLVTGFLLVAQPSARTRQVALVLAFLMVPLVYGEILSLAGAWHTDDFRRPLSGQPLWPLLLTLGPLVVLALVGVRRTKGRVGEMLLLAWPPAAGLTYLVTSGSAHDLVALEGISLPLAVLVARSADRLSERVHQLVAVAGLAALTLPGMVYGAQAFRDFVRGREVPYALARGEDAALRHLAAARQDTPVLATPYLADAIPALAGRRAVVADPPLRRRLAAGEVGSAELAGVLAQRGADSALVDCHTPQTPIRAGAGAVGLRTRRFACALLVTRAPARLDG